MSHFWDTFVPAMILITVGLATYMHRQRVGAWVEQSQRTVLAKNTKGIDYTFAMGLAGICALVPGALLLIYSVFRVLNPIAS
jgi:hypothetical protein